jgi:dienelactone hydrolase
VRGVVHVTVAYIVGITRSLSLPVLYFSTHDRLLLLRLDTNHEEQNMKSVLLTLAAGLIFVLAPNLSAQTQEELRNFDYDKNAPLGIKQIGVEKRGDVSIHDISYRSPKGGVVPAYLVVPKGIGPFAAVVWGHWYWSNSPMRNRKEFLEEAVALAPASVVSLLTDGPIARPGHKLDPTPLNEQQAYDLVQAVIDMRRGIDLLVARKDVDPKRIAFVGHSYNAAIGAFLSGIDRRPKAYVLMAGGLSDEVDLKTPQLQKFREQVGAEKFDAFIKKYSWLDQGKYVAKASPAFVFMQFATKEDFLTPDHVRQYEKIVSDPKRLEIYEATHALNAEARRDRIAFLTEQLKLKPLPASVIANIPDLYQPPRPTQ